MSLDKIEARDAAEESDAATEFLERAFIDRPSQGDLRLLVLRATEEGDDDPETALAIAIGQAWLMGARVAVNTALDRSPCRVCGCWELEACDGGCGWADPGLCTACASPADELETCLACAMPFNEGDLVLNDASGGALHAACCGPERESYTNAAGEPLGPDDPIPTGYPWTRDPARAVAA